MPDEQQDAPAGPTRQIVPLKVFALALAGVVCSVKGQILTVKMVGPKSEVEAAKPILEAYCKSLRMAE